MPCLASAADYPVPAIPGEPPAGTPAALPTGPVPAPEPAPTAPPTDRGRAEARVRGEPPSKLLNIDVEGASEARLSGADISWRWPQGRFRGRVTGDRIVGDLNGKPVQLERR